VLQFFTLVRPNISYQRKKPGLLINDYLRVLSKNTKYLTLLAKLQAL
jgi:hypothetical protein